MYVAGIYRRPNTPIADFTQFIIDKLEYTNNCLTVFVCQLNIDVLSHTNAMRNFVDTFHQYGIINDISFIT